MHGRFVGAVIELAGGIVGGIVGYFAFIWLVEQGFYGLMLPGALVGLGCGLVARQRSVARGALCAIGALGLELFAEWKSFPFAKDDTFGFLVTHFHEKAPIKIVMLLVGAALAFWLGKDGSFAGRSNAGKPAAPTSDRGA